jgi:hypothetical protein
LFFEELVVVREGVVVVRDEDSIIILFLIDVEFIGLAKKPTGTVEKILTDWLAK